MTAAALLHLAELAGDAARYYRRSHPAWARAMAYAAHTARLAAAYEQSGEALDTPTIRKEGKSILG